jgi:hypothetical protein
MSKARSLFERHIVEEHLSSSLSAFAGTITRSPKRLPLSVPRMSGTKDRPRHRGPKTCSAPWLTDACAFHRFSAQALPEYCLNDAGDNGRLDGATLRQFGASPRKTGTIPTPFSTWEDPQNDTEAPAFRFDIKIHRRQTQAASQSVFT